ncbi:MAG TPA: hypothetical protein VHY34_03945 [Caulobacteraceae bacterium]|jgi:hypothetical protein|nr:hypothetical protein [Caulobacteraceae bacterium]
MTRTRFHGFHFHSAPLLTFLMAFVVLILAASLACSIAPWS